MAEYKLSYTAKEIDEKLGKIKDYVSWNDLTDKPFYEEPGLVEILPETAATEYTDPTFGQTWMFTTAPALVVGETYTVIYNGVSYECVGMPAPEGYTSDTKAVALGNFAVVGGTDTGEPFAMLVMPTFETIMVIDLVGATSVTLSIKQEQTVVAPLPTKYLPDGVPYCVSGGSKTEILPECQLTTDEDGVAFLESIALPLVVGETYVVNWNGTEYDCVAQDASAMQPGAICLGNFDMLLGTGDTGEPFVVADLPDYATVVFISLDGATELTVAIYVYDKEIRKLDNRCLDLEWLPTVEKMDATILLMAEFDCDGGVTAGTVTHYEYRSNDALSLTDGRKYKVFWDGTYYDCVCSSQYVEEQGITLYFLGNKGVSSTDFENTGEPFLFYVIGRMMTQIHATTEGVHTAEIVENDEAPNKMPAGFLPDDATELYLTSQNGTKYAVTVSDDGTLTAAAVTK